MKEQEMYTLAPYGELPHWWPCWTRHGSVVPIGHTFANAPCDVTWSVALSWKSWRQTGKP